MDIKKSIEAVAQKRIRSVAKDELIYSSADDARDTERSVSDAKDEKSFDKIKKECLATIEVGEKAVKPWEKEMNDWDAGIKDLEKEIAAEKEKIAQQQREVDAVSKAIDEINADIKAYNDSLLLGESDPRARPLVLKRNTDAKLASALAALSEAAGLAQQERERWTNLKGWVAKPINELKEIKSRMSKAKFSKNGKK